MEIIKYLILFGLTHNRLAYTTVFDKKRCYAKDYEYECFFAFMAYAFSSQL